MSRSKQMLGPTTFVAAVLLCGAEARAETQPEDIRAPTAAAPVLARAPAPRADSALSPLTAFSVEGTTEGGNATVKYGGEWNVLGDGKGTFGTYSISLSAPLDDDADFTSPLTLDGLSNAASIKLQLSQLVVPAVPFADEGTDNGPICERMRAEARRRKPGEAAPPCDTFNVNDLLGADDARRFNAARNVVPKALIYRGLSGRVGYKKYSFYDPNTLAKGELDRTPWRVAAFWSWIGGHQDWSVTADYVHEVSFEQAPTKTACLAGTGPVLSCVSGPLARTERVTRDILSLEARFAFGPRALGIVQPKWGLAPKAVYDANNDEWAVGLPVYLFGDSSGLTGGIRADWESKAHDIIVGVFLTKTFSISDGL